MPNRLPPSNVICRGVSCQRRRGIDLAAEMLRCRGFEVVLKQ